MNGCKHIKKRIDEADKPDLLPLDVSEHVRHCVECGRFARERSALRELVAAGKRVSAPVNFDAMLKARLVEVKTQRSFWWLGSTGYLRLGAATAGLVVLFFAAQYSGFLSEQPRQPNDTRVADLNPLPRQSPPVLETPAIAKEPASPVTVAAGKRQRPGAYGTPRVRGEVLLGRTSSTGDFTVEDGGVVLVRGRNGEIDVQMPTVSVGAQPLLYVGAGQRTARNVGTSF